jgi:hypothetical protein
MSTSEPPSMRPKEPRFDYLRCQRHILLDMHVPDFDEGFLRGFDPARNVELYSRAGADAVMLYCNSHVGLSYYPTAIGRIHPGLNGRDVVGESVDALHERGLAVCAYYSVNFNNSACEQNPDWQIQIAGVADATLGEQSRCSVCCPGNKKYLEFACAQTEELVRSYEFDAFFFDMVFWTGVCVCNSCRERYRDEFSADIPRTIDWWSPEWCTFQATRERWLAEQLSELVSAVKKHRGIPAFANGGNIFSNWQAGASPALAAANDLLGGDVTPAPARLYTFGQLATRLSPTVMQYMHSASGYGSGAAQLKSVEEQQTHALVGSVFGGQFMAIDAVQPDGTVYAPTYERLAEVFAAMKPYEEFLGGSPVADFAVYYSLAADVSFRDNGLSVEDVRHTVFAPLDHGTAVVGAIAALQNAHLPAGVITRANLDELDAFPVVVLPNVLRMDDAEIAAFRSYVERGGCLYASGYTSLVDVRGVKHPDFALADVFGCHFEQAERAAVVYVKPASELAEEAIAPAAVVPHGTMVPAGSIPDAPTAVLLRADPRSVTLATLTLPYALGRGTRHDREWASIWTSPPWQDTDRPVIVERRHGNGRVIYSGCDIEASAAGNSAASALFVRLVRRLLDRPPTFEANTHPSVWIVAFDEPQRGRIRVNLLNHQAEAPVLPVPRVSLSLTPPQGCTFTALSVLPGGDPLAFDLSGDGRLHADIRDLQLFQMVAADYRQDRHP